MCASFMVRMFAFIKFEPPKSCARYWFAMLVISIIANRELERKENSVSLKTPVKGREILPETSD